MDICESRNVHRVFQALSAQWGCPIWLVKRFIKFNIDESYENAKFDPEAQVRWDTYFPNGKPTPDQYVLRLGKAYENGEDIPLLF